VRRLNLNLRVEEFAHRFACKSPSACAGGRARHMHHFTHLLTENVYTVVLSTDDGICDAFAARAPAAKSEEWMRVAVGWPRIGLALDPAARRVTF